MAHEVETMAYAGELPWHGLGQRIDDQPTPETMQQAAGLAWTIVRLPIYTKQGDAEIRVPNMRALVRSSDQKVMTIASSGWHPVQNADMLGFFRDYSEAGGAKLETAGSLRGGQIVWALANLHDGYTVGAGDRVNGYLLFTSSHKVGTATEVRLTQVRVVCQNTLTRALSHGEGHYKQNHLTAFNFDAAKAAIEQAHEGLRHAGNRAKRMHELKLSVADRLRTLAPFFGAGQLDDAELADPANHPKSLADVLVSVEKAPGAEPGTAWGVLNGVTHWADHVQGRTAATRMFNSWIGEVARLKLKVESKLSEMAE